MSLSGAARNNGPRGMGAGGGEVVREGPKCTRGGEGTEVHPKRGPGGVDGYGGGGVDNIAGFVEDNPERGEEDEEVMSRDRSEGRSQRIQSGAMLGRLV